jgi:hypothetical protein
VKALFLGLRDKKPCFLYNRLTSNYVYRKLDEEFPGNKQILPYIKALIETMIDCAREEEQLKTKLRSSKDFILRKLF